MLGSMLLVTLLVGSVTAGTVPAEEIKPAAPAAADVLVPRGAYEAARQLAAEQQRQSTSDSSSGGLSWLRQNSVSEAFSVLFPVSGLDPLICKTTNDDNYNAGICLRVTDCLYYRGESFGACGGGIGSCCVFAKKCGETTDMFISHFVSSTFSSVDKGSGECKLTVNPMNSNICQYRLDFDAFSIIGPDASSNCVDDFFGVTGGSYTPKVCGDLTGQHMYINVKPGGGPIVLTMDTSSVRTMGRKWDIKITQISCNSPDRAPAGCLQFFNETSGSVKSFNFRRQNAFIAGEGPGELQNMNYGVCINSKVGYCDVTWNQNPRSDFTFTISGDASVPSEQFTSKSGTTECTSDFITIPGGYVETDARTTRPAERFCGTKFPEVKTASQPYTLHVVTDVDEEGDKENFGFELNFRQNLCNS
ncbi:uncharacterized protein LOC108672785 [Hyalella azteca]|uniref:Uncharacterized protein LOC108672785 n=1 Tax=Hyalella azteca TaxID=294128 RepID=A0A8B7NQP2_HYAAZ|nr:uncharacterized protein LOC108672785 [Hyalella azteca]